MNVDTGSLETAFVSEAEAAKDRARALEIAGAAHDLNNVLQTICSYSQILSEKFSSGGRVSEIAKNVMGHALEMGEISGRILSAAS